MNLVRQERGDSICPYCHNMTINRLVNQNLALDKLWL